MSDVATLLAQLEGQKRQDREAAARALGAATVQEAVPALIRALDTKYTKVRTAAAMALAQIGDERAIPPLIELTAANSYSLRSVAGVALSTIGGGAVPYLIDALQDERTTVRQQAVKALGRIGDRSAVLPLLDDRSLNVRYDAAQALEKLGDERAIPDLVRAVKRKGKSSCPATAGRSPTRRGARR